MKRLAALAALLVATAAPAFAQEISVLGSSAVRGSSQLQHGLGMSLAGSFRLGNILVDTSWARRANAHVGLRVSVTESSFATQAGFLCIDFCPPNANAISVKARTTKTTLNVLPVVNRTTRFEINGGVASYRQDQFSAAFNRSWRSSAWGFVTGAAVSRRFGASPLWMHVAYTRHAEPVAQLADDGQSTPKHSVAAGLTFRAADRTKR